MATPFGEPSDAFVTGRLAGLKVVVDCAHGACYKTTPAVLRELGAEVTVLNALPDGRNINLDCGALHLERLLVLRGLLLANPEINQPAGSAARHQENSAHDRQRNRPPRTADQAS